MSFAHPSVVAAVGLLAATSKKTTSSGGSTIFLVFLVLIVGAYFLFIAPQRRKMRAQMNQQPQVEVGDEVVTNAGLYGTIVSFDGDRVQLEIAPGTVIEVARAAVGRRVQPAPAADDEADDEDEQGDDDGAEDAHHWEPPEEDEEAAEGLASDGTAQGAEDGAHEPAASGDWAHPWEGGARGDASASGGAS